MARRGKETRVSGRHLAQIVREPLGEEAPSVGTPHEERGREGVAQGGRRPAHEGGQHTAGGLARPRIEDVASARAREGSPVRSGDGEGGALTVEVDYAWLALAGDAPPDAPRPPARRGADRVDAARPAVQERRGNPVLAQDLDGGVDRRPLADGPEVQLHPRLGEPDGVVGGIETDEVHPDEASGRGCLPRAWTEFGPEPDERAHGGVEGALGQPGELGAALEEAEDGRADADGGPARPGVDPGDLARGAIAAQPLLGPRDLAERLLADRPQADGVLPEEQELEAGGHRLEGDGHLRLLPDGGDGPHVRILRLAESKRTSFCSR